MKNNFFEGDKESDNEVIENIIKDRFDVSGINIIPDKEILTSKTNDQEGEYYERDEDSEKWKSRDFSEDWKGDPEAGLLRYINKRENSILFFQILADKYPQLGVILNDSVTDNEGKFNPEYVAVLIDNEKGMREVVKSILDNPIIDLLVTSLGDRYLFDRNLEKVATHGFLPMDTINKIKARYLYLEYEYEKENGLPEQTRTGQEIFNWESTFLKDEELKELFESVIEEELSGRGII